MKTNLRVMLLFLLLVAAPMLSGAQDVPAPSPKPLLRRNGTFLST